jgi:hypothetical protein
VRIFEQKHTGLPSSGRLGDVDQVRSVSSLCFCGVTGRTP